MDAASLWCHKISIITIMHDIFIIIGCRDYQKSVILTSWLVVMVCGCVVMVQSGRFVFISLIKSFCSIL